MSLWRGITSWVTSRFGLKAQVLRPVPDYSINPLYWLGAITVVAFLLQVVTGLLMLIYYVPTTEQAYSSTLFITKYVPLGWMLESVHLYGAYAMILLAFLHMFRGYFASVHKSPREMMWVIGMLMGFVVLAFGLTGYLLTWSVVSKSATDVSIGMLSFLPAQIGPVLTFLLAGPGSNAAELSRFFDLHIVVLPAILLTLLGIKLWMFEAHGAAEPPSGPKPSKDVPWFPSVMLYFTMIGSLFVALVVFAAAVFPAPLAAEYTPAAASSYVPQPEWYFLWIYQILKFASFEGSGIYYALGGVTIVALALILLPFIDRSPRRNPASRPLFLTLGMILVAELIALTAWGYLTPGQVIPDSEAAAVLGGIAVAFATMSWLTFRARAKLRFPESGRTLASAMVTPLSNWRLTLLFLVLLTVGSIAFGNLLDGLRNGLDAPALTAYFALLSASFYIMVRVLKNLGIPHRREP